VVATGRATRFGGIAAALASREPPTAFERGIHRLGVGSARKLTDPYDRVQR